MVATLRALGAGIERFLQVDVQRDHPPLDVDVLDEDHLAVFPQRDASMEEPGQDDLVASPKPGIIIASSGMATGGRVLALVWGPAELCQGAAYLAALGRLMPPPPPGAPGPGS